MSGINIGDLIREEQIKQAGVQIEDKEAMSTLIERTKHMLESYFHDFFDKSYLIKNIESEKKNKRFGVRGTALGHVSHHAKKVDALKQEVLEASKYLGFHDSQFLVRDDLLQNLRQDEVHMQRIRDDIGKHFAEIDLIQDAHAHADMLDGITGKVAEIQPKRRKKYKKKQHVDQRSLISVDDIISCGGKCGFTCAKNVPKMLDGLPQHVRKNIQSKFDQISAAKQGDVDLFQAQLLVALKKRVNRERYNVIKLGNAGDHYRLVLNSQGVVFDICDHATYLRKYVS